mgnify:CR=1 FL=1
MNREDELFKQGLDAFNNRRFYDAHELWEELWSDYKLEEPNLIQGLIQVAVGYYHLSNLNQKGSIGLFTKSIKKLDPYVDSKSLPVDIALIIQGTKKTLDWIKVNDDLKAFNWNSFKSIDMQ